MKRLLYSSLIILAVLMTSCTYNYNRDWTRGDTSKDTIYTAKAAMDIYDYNPERALLIIDSAEIVGNLKHDQALYFRAKIFTMTFEGIHLDSAQRICVSLMNSNYIKNTDNKESVLDLLVSICRRKQDFEQWLLWSTKKAEFCRQQNNEVEALRTEAEIGVILEYLGNHDEGLQILDNVISKLDGVRKFNEMDACIIALRRKVDVLQQSEIFEDIIPVAHKIIEKINDYEQHPDEYHDGSFREPKAANVPDYCNFYRVKAYAYLARAYAEIDDVANARPYLALFENSRYGQTFDGRMMISMTWCRLGDFDKMIAIYDEAENYIKDDTINDTYATILYNRALAAEANKQYVQAYNYLKRHALVRLILTTDNQKSEANEYAAKYRAQEQRLEIERRTLHNRMQNIIILTMFIALIVTLFFYNYSIYQKRKLAARNVALVRLIDERAGLDTLMSNNKNEKLIDRHLSEACKMLSEKPDMSVSAVAKAVGLPVQNLQKLFREQFGMSPVEYRTSHKK